MEGTAPLIRDEMVYLDVDVTDLASILRNSHPRGNKVY